MFLTRTINDIELLSVPVYNVSTFFQVRRVSAHSDFSISKLDMYDRWTQEIPQDAYVGVFHSMSTYHNPNDNLPYLSFNLLGVMIIAFPASPT